MTSESGYAMPNDNQPDLPVPEFIILVPYHSKDESKKNELLQFQASLEKILPPCGRLCIIEQACEGQSFNRGQLLNAGFSACVANGLPLQWLRPKVVVIHDTSLVPDQATLASYGSGSSQDPVRVFTAALQRFGNAGCFGGAYAITPEAFEGANGFPNTFWGHAGEDSALQHRLRKVGINWSQHFGNFDSLTEKDVSILGGESLSTMKELRQHLTIDKRRWQEDGLSTVNFSIETEKIFKRGDTIWGIHLVAKLKAIGLRCGRCHMWQPESCYSRTQALQWGPPANTVCKGCLAPVHQLVETNAQRNQDESRRSCDDCGMVFASRSQLFKHFPKCGEIVQSSECIPCAPATAPPRPVSPRRTAHILEFTSKLSRVASLLTTQEPLPSACAHEQIVRRVVASQTLTFQSKATNVTQLNSLLACIEAMALNRSSIILEMGAGKALLTRSIYEMLHRRVPVVALDNRPISASDPFYDPPDVCEGDAPYTRIVANVQDNQWSQHKEIQGPILAVTKHLCGGFTDASLMRVCEDLKLESVCIAPCCHQKMQFREYCNHPYLKAAGFETERDFKDLLFLLQVSKHSDLKDNEYRNRSIIELLPFSEIKSLGRMARRLIEEGRASYLRDRGFDVEVRRYVSDEVTPDNLVIMAHKSALHRD